MNAVTHLEKVIVGEVSAVTHLEKVIAGETSAVTYTEKVITGEATPITHLQRVIAGVESPVTHLEYVWAGSSPTPTEHEYTGVVPYSFNADGEPLLDWYIKGNTVQNGTPTPQNPVMPQGCGDLETTGEHTGQYKIPISSANTTTPVYLGEVQTTRNVKKLVFDGTENTWQEYSNPKLQRLGATMPISDMKANSRANGFCTHFRPISSPSQNTTVNGITFGASNNFIYITFSVDTATAYNLTDVTSVKTWLSQQYANGTPVTVWYVLATEKTGIVNEPLMRIGDYADEVSNVATIPTVNGSNTIDVETAVKPSEVYIKYKGV